MIVGRRSLQGSDIGDQAADMFSGPSGRPTILTFVRHYLPGYRCGPITTISNLVEALGDAFDFSVVTSDRDAGDLSPYSDIVTDGTWTAVDKAKVLYLAPAQRGLRNIGKILREMPHDALYLNSFFDPSFTIRPLLARALGLAPSKPCIIAPRGEFSLGALQLKAWKKRPLLLTARTSGLYRGLLWQASSKFEQADIRKVLGESARDIRIAPDLAAATVVGDAYQPRAAGEPLRVCFLSRISPKKNLDFALEVLRQVQTPVRFHIYGPVEDQSYWSRCQRTMKRLPDTVRAAYMGSVKHTEVPALLATYDLFFLPTLGENYGHVIYEALSGGTPVLIADTTPWRNLADAAVGWDLPLDQAEAFGKKIDQMARMSQAEQNQMRMCARSLADKHRMHQTLVDATRALFAEAVVSEQGASLSSRE